MCAEMMMMMMRVQPGEGVRAAWQEVLGKIGGEHERQTNTKGARRCFPILRQQIPAEYCQFHYPASKHTFTHRR